MTFRELGLIAPILHALAEQGYTRPSPIQEKAIPPALEGRDILGCAQTGTGKTCAFAAPILQRLQAVPNHSHPIRALVLTPTRELAIQIGESFDHYGKKLPLRCTVIFGGVGQASQVEALRQGSDLLVATPGRLIDLYQQGLLSLEQLEIFVLDEADRMLDMGFIHAVKKILNWLPSQKQTMLFSATMPSEISALADSLLHHPVRVAVNPISSPVESIEQSVCFVDQNNKIPLLAYLIQEFKVKNALVFTRTKHGANKVARSLNQLGISSAAIHGNKSQTARQQALSDFKAGKICCLVATDIAARGLDIEDLSHVFNYNLPEVPETYVHRIGRTGRAGRGGQAVSFCEFGEKPLLKEIERLLGHSVPVMESHPFPMQIFSVPKRDKQGRVLHEEDLEARQAARAQRRVQDEAAQAIKKQQRQTKQKAESKLQKIQSQEGKQKGKKKLTRPGKRLETGQTVPQTEFHRPDPLAGDEIMDATARLLAPRKSRVVLSETPAKSVKSAKSAKSTKSAKPARPAKQAKTAKPAKSAQPVPSAPKAEGRARPYSRQSGYRIPPEPKKSGQTKDSTQQKSLMKPYYLDF